MFIVAGTCVNIWAAMQAGAIPQPDPGSRFYIDDTGKDYKDDINRLYQDGEPT